MVSGTVSVVNAEDDKGTPWGKEAGITAEVGPLGGAESPVVRRGEGCQDNVTAVDADHVGDGLQDVEVEV